MINASEFYTKRVKDLSCDLKKVVTLNKWFYAVRLALFSLTVVFIILFIRYDFSSFYLFLSIGVFVLFLFAIVFNQKNINLERFISKSIELNNLELNFLNFNFKDREDGEQFSNLNPHLSQDFDLFGKNSLYQYLNRSVTFLGKRLLAKGLSLATFDKEIIQARQKAIAELANKRVFVEKFSTYGSFLNETGDEVDDIKSWLADSKNQLPILKISAIFFTLLFFIFLFFVFLGWINVYTLLIPVSINLLVVKLYNKKITKAHLKLSSTSNSFKMYSTLIHLAENEIFQTPYLHSIQKNFKTEKQNASQSIKALFRILTNLDVRYNVYLSLLLNSVFVFDLHVLLSLEKWKFKNGQFVPCWFDSLSQLDELMSYAVFYFNNNSHTIFPQLSDHEFEYQASDLAHPLLDPIYRVPNSIKISGIPKVIIVTGANMAGKSTFLRTIVVNMILAMNGSAICASSFRFTPCDIMSSIKIQDSLANKESYFYAELLRLKSVINHYDVQPKTIVVLDEILRGTNSKDKQIGTIGLLKKLIKKNAIVIIATHDLEIGKLENDYPNVVSNYCFEVELVENQLVFDYKLKEGISTKLNASFLMEKMGILN